jgi:hypothetical protein
MASQAGRRGEALVAVYCATKAAIISLTQSAGLALRTCRQPPQLGGAPAAMAARATRLSRLCRLRRKLPD